VGLLTTRAIVLKTYRYSDTSKILRLMTRDHGPRSVIARGALRPKSRFGGLLELFAEGEATLYFRENRDLHTLSGFELVRERRSLGRDLDRFAGASVLCELIMRLAPEHRDDHLYDGLVSGLDDLVRVPSESVPAAALATVWRLVSILGFAPDLESCLDCQESVGSGQAARFDFAAGGLRCARCAPHGRTVIPAELESLRRLTTGRLDGEVTPGQGSLLADYIRYHMAEGSTLKSLPFLAELP